MTSSPARHFPYQDPSLPLEERVQDLLARMTPQEKLAQLGSLWLHDVAPRGQFRPELAAQRLQLGIGQITRVAGASDCDARGIAALANQIQHYLVEQTRLGIPAIVHEECCAGFMARGATVFPQLIGLASTWQPALAEQMASVIRRQMRAVGAHHGLAPVLDVARDPRWGRIEETFGEDPYLVARMGVAYIRGLQGADLKQGIAATGKHFAAYSVPEGGMNWAPVHVGPRELREVYLLPFEAAIREAGLASIMPGYHEIDGIPVSADRYLLTEVLRGELGFDGLVVSDYMAVANLATHHHTAASKSEAGLQALLAGIDLELPATDCYGPGLLAALQEGRLDPARLDEAVRRVLRLKFALGLFEQPYVDERAAAVAFDTPADRALAREIARQSLVLLKNDGPVLPLRRDLRSLAVIGPAAHRVRLLHGDYHYAPHIEFTQQTLPADKAFPLPQPPAHLPPEEAEAALYHDYFTPCTSILAGIRARVSPHTQVLYARGCDLTDLDTSGFAEAVAAARQAEVAVVVVGEQSGLTRESTCGEFRDRATLGLPGVQEELVKAVVATGTPTVVVIVGGRPLALPWLAEHVPAILLAWIPGEEGGHAVAEALFGEVNPGGKLPVSLPRGVGQLPLFYNHRPTGGRSHIFGDYADLRRGPLFPFGHGLSYTTFAYHDLTISPAQVDPQGTVRISCTVTNTGARAGDEVVQLYLRDRVASLTRPVQELKGFQRVSLRPGESRRLTFHVDTRQLAFYDHQLQLIVEPGEIEVLVGSSAADILLRGAFTITGATTPVQRRALASQVEVTELQA